MGLDISYYRKLTPAPDAKMEDGYIVDYNKFAQFHHSTLSYTEENWPGHTDGLKAGAYTFAGRDGFRAGSYGGYNQWRDELSRFALHMPAEQAWEKVKEGPFVELIHFADNEGVIGPVVSAKLAKDFAEFEERAGAYAASHADGDWFIAKYRDWKKAFEAAADDGAVDFH